MLGLYLILFSLLIYIGIPVGIIYLIVKLVAHNSNKNSKVEAGITHTTSITRDITIAFLVISGAFVGILALYSMPTQLLGLTSKASIFVAQLVAGVVILLGGLAFRGLVRNFLMAVGTLTILVASPYVFESFGSAGALLVLFVAMVVLIAVTIRLSKKGSIRDRQS